MARLALEGMRDRATPMPTNCQMPAMQKTKPHTAYIVGTISRKTSDSTDKCNGQNLLDIAVTNALELLRGQNFRCNDTK
jgi:hypothetical protein